MIRTDGLHLQCRRLYRFPRTAVSEGRGLLQLMKTAHIVALAPAPSWAEQDTCRGM